MTDLNKPEASDSTTWRQLRSAAAMWISGQLAEQIQRIGPDLREDLHPAEPEAGLDLLPDFEAEP